MGNEREIKFRAWDKRREKMFEVINLDWFVNSGCTDRLPSNICMERERLDEDGKFVEIEEKRDVLTDEIELMQYTGLKDKNGKEIYEGDIVKIGNSRLNDTTDIAEISFCRGGFMLHLKGYFGYRDIERIDGDCRRHKVIGNIYENQELFRGANDGE